MLPNDWQDLLAHEVASASFERLQGFVDVERQRATVYPPQADVFAALARTAFGDTRVVILGQDPYHGPGQAHGLSFSVPHGIAIPPSLRNIYAELHDDLAIAPPLHGCLTQWADRGVLLLNTVLTVRAHEPASHRGEGWESFTDRIIELLSARVDSVVFVLWGNHARSKAALIDDVCNTIIESPHPSPLAARRGFFGSRPFSRVNAALTGAGGPPIDWSLV